MIVTFAILFIGSSKIFFQRWMNPVFLIWSVLGLWVLMHDYGIINYQPIGFRTNFFILIINISISFGIYIGYILSNVKSSYKGLFSLREKIVYLVVGAAFVGIILNGGWENIINILGSREIIRENPDSLSNNYFIVSAVLIYPAIVISPISFYYYLKTKCKVYLYPNIVIIVMAVLSASRALMLIYIIIAINIYLLDGSKKSLVKLIKAAILISILFIAIGLMRDGNIESDIKDYSEFDVPVSILLAEHYMVGSYSALNDYFENNIHLPSGDISNTFPIIAKFSRLLDNTITVNEYRYELSFENPKTNIYTVYKEIYEDFGISGSIFFSIFFGFIVGFLYKMVYLNNINQVIVPLAILYTFIFYSIFYSVFLFSPVVISLLLPFLVKIPKVIYKC